MHPAFSVILLTTLIGAGQGLYLALYTVQVYSVFKVLPVQDSIHFNALGSLIVLVFLAAGLIASFFHLGRPERAWRSAACWRTSWLSREVIALPAFMAAVAAWGLIQFMGWNPLLFTFGHGLEIDLSMFVGAVATLLCFTLFLFTGMIYACIKQLQEWATPLTVINYTLLGIGSGFILATAFAAWRRLGDIHNPGCLYYTNGQPGPQCPDQVQINAGNSDWHPPRPYRAESAGRHGGIIQHTRIFPRRFTR